jgi:hypothetical protein
MHQGPGPVSLLERYGVMDRFHQFRGPFFGNGVGDKSAEATGQSGCRNLSSRRDVQRGFAAIR